MGFEFQKSEAYGFILEFIDHAYHASGRFPGVERFALVSQLKRASTSIALNFAEGWGRFTPREKQQYYRMSRASLLECVAILDIALRQRYLAAETHASLLGEAERLSRILVRLMQSHRARR